MPENTVASRTTRGRWRVSQPQCSLQEIERVEEASPCPALVSPKGGLNGGVHITELTQQTENVWGCSIFEIEVSRLRKKNVQTQGSERPHAVSKTTTTNNNRKRFSDSGFKINQV